MADQLLPDPIAAAARELAQLDKARERVTVVTDSLTGDDRLIGFVVPDDHTLQTYDLSHYEDNPRTKTGLVALADGDSFVEYVNRHSMPRATTLWADIDSNRVVGVLDDHERHQGDEEKLTGEDLPGYGKHRAVLTLKHTKDWLHWLKFDGKYLTQDDFAAHIEDGANCIRKDADGHGPDAATMLEVAQTFHANRGVRFTSSQHLSGEVQLEYQSETKAGAGKAGDIRVPDLFTLGLHPYEGNFDEVFPLTARFRYRLGDGTVSLGYRLIRPDVVKQSAFNEIVAGIKAGADLPVMNGTPRS